MFPPHLSTLGLVAVVPDRFLRNTQKVGAGRCWVQASSSADSVPMINPFLLSVPHFHSSCGCHRESKCLLAPCSHSSSQWEPQSPGEEGLSRALSCSYPALVLSKGISFATRVILRQRCCPHLLSTGQKHPSCRRPCSLFRSTRAWQSSASLMCRPQSSSAATVSPQHPQDLCGHHLG